MVIESGGFENKTASAAADIEMLAEKGNKMNIIAIAFVAFVFTGVIFFKIYKIQGFMNLSFGEKIESIGTSMFFACLVSLPVLVVASIPMRIIIKVIRLFSTSAAETINVSAYYLMRGAFWGIVFSMGLLILAIVVLNGVVVPFKNYADIVKIIYDNYRAGKFYSIFIQTVSRGVTIGCAVFYILFLLPQFRGEILLNRHFEKGCMGVVAQNGSIQSGNDAYLRKSLFGSDWYRYIEEKQCYQRYRDGEQKADLDFFARNEKVKTKCANINGMLIGVIDDYHIYLRSLSGLSYRTTKCDWKSKYISNGKCDYDRIFEIVKSSWSGKISISEMAAIVGFMQEKALIGLGLDEPTSAFFEEREDGGYFIFYTKKGVWEFGAYDVDVTKPIMAVENIALFVDTTGKFCWIDMSSKEAKAEVRELALFIDSEDNYYVGRMDKLKEEYNKAVFVESEVKTFNYYITDENGIRCCVYGEDSKKLYLFSIGSSEGISIIKADRDVYGDVENIYFSKSMGLVIYEKGWATFGNDE